MPRKISSDFSGLYPLCCPSSRRPPPFALRLALSRRTGFLLRSSSSPLWRPISYGNDAPPLPVALRATRSPVPTDLLQGKKVFLDPIPCLR